MLQPAPRMIRAPLKKSNDVPSTVSGGVIGAAIGAARRVLKRHGRNR